MIWKNGWVYWSNWAGLSDVTRMMQIQRGLGAAKNCRFHLSEEVLTS